MIRGRWAIEGRFYGCAALTSRRAAPRYALPAARVMAALRNLAISILRLAGHTAALRYRVGQAQLAPPDDHECQETLRALTETAGGNACLMCHDNVMLRVVG